METSKPSAEANLSESIVSQGDSLALISPLLDDRLESKRNEVDSGSQWHGLFAFYDRVSSSWRTSQHSLFGEWEESLENWPRAGTMRNGECYPRAPLVLHTHGSACSSWLTPVARDWKGYTKREGESICNQLRALYGGIGKPNPQWLAWLMGFDVDWATVNKSKDSAT
jgi:hypothetical protein